MNLLVVASLILAFFADFLVEEFSLGRVARLWPELVAGAGALTLAIQLASRKRMDLPPKYALWLLAMAALVLVGWTANRAPSGGMVIGIREYLKFVPFLLIPVVYRFSDQQLVQQFRWLLVFCVLQLPIVLYQLAREVGLHGGRLVSGDLIVGSLTVSSVLSVVLISTWTVAFAFFLRKRLAAARFAVLSLLLLLPTMLNETKGSLVLLPVAAIAPFLARPGKVPVGKIIVVLVLVGVVAGIYSKIDESLLGHRKSVTMVELFTDPEKLRAYLSPQAEGRKWMGRGDKINLAYEELSQDPVKLMIGVGIGNATESPLGAISGEYADVAENRLIGVGANRLFWETGLLGVLLSFGFIFMVARDALHLGRHCSGLQGAFANGWFAVAALQAVSMFYIDPFRAEALGLLFWLYSGVLVAEKARVARALVDRPFGNVFETSVGLASSPR